MLPIPKIFEYTSELTLKRSGLLPIESLPKDDQTNWLFLVIGTKRFSFVYKIENPESARYNEPFPAFIHFIFPELIKDNITINETYEIMRAEEAIGTCKIIAQSQ